MSEFLSQLSAVQQAEQDFEWYPTTAEIIQALCKSLSSHAEDHRYDRHRSRCFGSFLDIGAGNGKVLDGVRDLHFIEKLHAIEKSRTLIGRACNIVSVKVRSTSNPALWPMERSGIGQSAGRRPLQGPEMGLVGARPRLDNGGVKI